VRIFARASLTLSSRRDPPLRPGHAKDEDDSLRWVTGKFVKAVNSKTEFSYSFEMGHNTLFCLSAKRIGEKFYISQYRDFPRCCDLYLNKTDRDNGVGLEDWIDPPSHYIAVLEPDRRKVATYRLCLTANPSNQGTLTMAKDIATVSQSTFTIREASSAPIRAMKISIPPLVTISGQKHTDDVGEDEEPEPDYQVCQGMSNDMWSKYHATPILSQIDAWTQHVRLNPRKDPNDKFRAPRIRLLNKTPFWNPDVGSLVVKFDRSRVTMASSKNFIVFHEKDVKDRSKTSSDAILQFGKVGKKNFTLDYKKPLCALQAFGIALSAFGWKGDDAKM